MAATLFGNKGQLTWSGARSREGHRTYKVRWRVETGPREGPYVAMTCPELPQIGDRWQIDDDDDLWAFFTPEMEVEPVAEKGPNRYWDVTQTATTEPLFRCATNQIENPLLEPQGVSGDSTEASTEAVFDRHGKRVINSAHEQVHGPLVEVDDGRDTITISQNVATLELSLFTAMRNKVNSAPIWGMPRRCVRLKRTSWERKLFGTCSFYYTRRFTFEIDARTHDRTRVDEGTKVLHGHWGTVPGGDTQLFLSISDGVISDASILVPGVGYPKNSQVSLTVLPNDTGTGGLVVVGTDGDGVPVEVLSIPSAGSGYKPGTAETATARLAWNLDNIGGEPPDPNNPQHFDRYKDINGENDRVILNGFGVPADTLVGSDASPFAQSGSPGEFKLEYYEEANFLLLGLSGSVM